MSILEVRNLRKSFDGAPVLKDVSFSLEKGECLAILGNSGSGKSTCLRCINLLERPDGGSILFQGEDILSRKTDENRVRSRINMVFQSFNLFANMNVLQNCMIAQRKVLHRGKEEAKKIAMENLAKVGLSDKADAFPSTLSGGQKQRVAIARSLCMNPEILLFDEPTSALDPMMVAEVCNVMAKLRDEGVTMVLVTHQIEFARKISSKTLFLYSGVVDQFGDTGEVFAKPSPKFAEFLAVEKSM
ncbi:MAG: amino acid ABC transporter ATP-binding protein [Bacilli bacterium]|nr:amino acid ABC transporter ATP-binding protein [Bacilli bacterium]MBO6286437.1 amino acid ABC transporter ATP-binding protein [Bacilli bacterium]